jgi:serine/threonine protein kinase
VAAKPEDALVGRVVAGRYRLVAPVGTGAMATIYRAEQEAEPRKVAVKLVRPEILKNRTAAARFHREAKAASRLDHPGIVRVLDWGVDGELPYLVMELVDGEDLFDCLDREGRMDQSMALAVVQRLCDALAAAHAEGVIHRDLKPENIMLVPVDAPPGRDQLAIKVLDFGIAKLLGPYGDELWGDQTVPQVLTQVGSAVGTPSHMAPEQARGNEVDGRADIYACGVLLYEMVTGHLPFEGNNPIAVAVAQVRDPPVPPRSHLPDLHPAVERIILRCLEKAPEVRYQTAFELKDAITVAIAELEVDPSTRPNRDRVGDAPSAVTNIAPGATTIIEDPRTADMDPDSELPTNRQNELARLREIVVALRELPPEQRRPPAGTLEIDDEPSTLQHRARPQARAPGTGLLRGGSPAPRGGTQVTTPMAAAPPVPRPGPAKVFARTLQSAMVDDDDDDRAPTAVVSPQALAFARQRVAEHRAAAAASAAPAGSGASAAAAAALADEPFIEPEPTVPLGSEAPPALQPVPHAGISSGPPRSSSSSSLPPPSFGSSGSHPMASYPPPATAAAPPPYPRNGLYGTRREATPGGWGGSPEQPSEWSSSPEWRAQSPDLRSSSQARPAPTELEQLLQRMPEGERLSLVTVGLLVMAIAGAVVGLLWLVLGG